MFGGVGETCTGSGNIFVDEVSSLDREAVSKEQSGN